MTNFQQLEANNLLHFLSKYPPGSPVVKIFPSLIPYMVTALILSLIVYVLRRLIALKMSLDEKQILLEITPPFLTEKESYTTEQLFSHIQALGEQRSLRNKLLGRKIQFSLEIISTKNEGIRYIIRSTPDKANTLKKTLISYLPQITIKEVKNYLPEGLGQLNKSKFKIVEYRLKNHFAYPLKKQDLLYKHDPISYITGMMTKLNPSELVSLQIILIPEKVKEVKKIQKFILKNGDTLHYLNSIKLFRFLSRAPNKTIERQSSSEQKIIESIEEKIKQPLFETSIRLLLISDNKESISDRLNGISSSFATFSSSDYQSLIPKKYLDIEFINRILFFGFRKRLSLINKSLLSVAEVSSIYHFPFANTNSTEDLVKTLSPELPAPLSLKKDRDLDVIFGKNTYGNATVDIGLTDEERAKHMYLIGRTGSGKSTVIFHMASADIQKGRGLAVIDPHGDLAEDLLCTVPMNRINDLIYFKTHHTK